MRKTTSQTLMDGVDYHPASKTLYVNVATAYRVVYRAEVNSNAVCLTLAIWERVKKLHPNLDIRQVTVKGGV